MNNNIIPEFDKKKDKSLSIDLQDFPDMKDTIVFHLNGYLDTKNSILFQERIFKAIKAGFVNLIFNCKKFTYLSSTGVGSFTEFFKEVKPKGGRIVLVNLQPKVLEVFDLLGLLQMFALKESVEDAVEFFKTAAETSEIFPAVFSCPVCSKKLQALKPGKFRCSQCKSGIQVNEVGQAILA